MLDLDLLQDRIATANAMILALGGFPVARAPSGNASFLRDEKAEREEKAEGLKLESNTEALVGGEKGGEYWCCSCWKWGRQFHPA